MAVCGETNVSGFKNSKTAHGIRSVKPRATGKMIVSQAGMKTYSIYHSYVTSIDHFIVLRNVVI
jgi:hypothetical protein